MKELKTLSILIMISSLAISCQKDPVTVQPGTTAFKYSDSIYYLNAADYTISPRNAKTGTYTAFPDNLKIDGTNGTITISLKGNDGQSQTGFRYKIKYTSGSVSDSTYITIAGLNYFDRFYNLAQNDSLITPAYNGNYSTLPVGTYGISADNKLAINQSNGQINIQETIRRGFFDSQLHASWKQTTIKYTTSDNPNVMNSMDIILYYYNTIADVPSNVSALMQAHQRMAIASMNAPAVPSTSGAIDNNLSSDLSLFKPRPPCIIIVGH